MRTIDFRGKAVGSGRWIHGDLVWNGRTPAIFEDANQENGCITVKEGTLGMNTGLKDKHGHEIYNTGDEGQQFEMMVSLLALGISL